MAKLTEKELAEWESKRDLNAELLQALHDMKRGEWARKTGNYHTEHIEWLKDPENAAGYLNAVIEEEDKDALLLALRNIAEAEGGMAAVAEKAHLKRESLCRMLSPRGNPALSNLFSILHGMGLKLTIQPDKAVTTA